MVRYKLVQVNSDDDDDDNKIPIIPIDEKTDDNVDELTPTVPVEKKEQSTKTSAPPAVDNDKEGWPAEDLQSILKTYEKKARDRAYYILKTIEDNGYKLSSNESEPELIYSAGSISSPLVTLLNWVVLPSEKGEERPADLSMFLKILDTLHISKDMYAKGRYKTAEKLLHSPLQQRKKRKKINQEENIDDDVYDKPHPSWKTIYKK